MFYFISSSSIFVLAVGSLGFEFCVFVAGWRYALQNEGPFIIIYYYIIIISGTSMMSKFSLN